MPYGSELIYQIPIFAVVWGGVFLGERLSVPLVAGCLVIFVGTALATGVLAPRSSRREPAAAAATGGR